MFLPIATIILVAQSLSDSCGISPHAKINVVVDAEPVVTKDDVLWLIYLPSRKK
jgi:hypothetical protein